MAVWGSNVVCSTLSPTSHIARHVEKELAILATRLRALELSGCALDSALKKVSVTVCEKVGKRLSD